MFASMHRRFAGNQHVLRSMLFSCAGTMCLAVSACLVHRAEPGIAADLSVISEREIDSVHAGNAYETIKRLRPMFLMTRGKMSVDPTVQAPQPNVYVDDQLYGDANALRSISALTIESIRFYTASAAQYKFGRGNEAGVIGIYTKH